MSQIVAENNKCESGLVVVKKVNHRFKELKKKKRNYPKKGSSIVTETTWKYQVYKQHS